MPAQALDGCSALNCFCVAAMSKVFNGTCMRLTGRILDRRGDVCLAQICPEEVEPSAGGAVPRGNLKKI